MIGARRRASRTVRHEAELPLGIGELARVLRRLLEAGHDPEGLVDRCRHLIEIEAGDLAWMRRQEALRRRVAKARHQNTTDEHG